VDDFGIKYKDRADAEHLLSVLQEEYRLTADWTGSKYLGMTIQHDVSSEKISISMPGYVQAALKRFKVASSGHLTHAPALYSPPVYGASVQYTPSTDTSTLTPAEVKFVQEVIGVFLYYSRAVDSTMFTTLNKLASQQSKPSKSLLSAVAHFLQYASSYPDAVLQYRASDMRLVVESDASYLSESNSRSRAGGILFLSSNGDPASAVLNGPIEIISCIIPSVVAAASEAEYAALFLNGKAAASVRNTLEDLGYPQTPTPIFADNTTACGIANSTSKIRRSKAIDMRFHWIRDRVKQNQFTVIWRPGGTNLADYFTKTHPVSHYRKMRETYVHSPVTPPDGWTLVEHGKRTRTQ
jgi:hypothetical protein